MTKSKFKIVLGLALGLVLGHCASAQTTNPLAAPLPPAATMPTNEIDSTTIGQDFANILQKVATSTNILWEAHAIYAKGLNKPWGAGVGAFYLINQYAYTGIRVDWVDGGFWMPEGNVGLQLPLSPVSWLTVTPFTYAGIGVPISGATIGGITIGGPAPKDNNGQPTAILGAGIALHLFNFSSGKYSVDALADIEKWSGFASNQKRFGLAIVRKF